MAGTEGLFCNWALGEDWAMQAESCDRQLLSKPKVNQIWADLVEARLNLHDTRRAAEAIAIWRKNVPGVEGQFPNFDLLEGDVAYSNGDWKAAETSYKKYVKLVPSKVAGWRRLASIQEILGDPKGAIDSVGGAIKAGDEPSKQAGRYAWRARLKISLRDWEGAGADLSEGNKLDATNEEVQSLYPQFERSEEWLPHLKSLDSRVLKSSQGTARASELLERSEWLANAEWNDLAFEDAAEAFENNPKSLRTEVWKGVLAWETGDGSKAGEVATTSLKAWVETEVDWKGKKLTPLNLLKKLDRETDPELRAEGLLLMKQPVLAWREVKEIDGARMKSKILLALEDLPKAEAAARRAAEVHPNEPGVWIELAELEFRNGNMKEALEELDRAKKLDSKAKVEELRASILKTQLP